MCPHLKATGGVYCGLSTAAVQPFSGPNISYDLPFRNIIYIIDCWHNYYDYFYVLLSGKSGTDTAQPNKTQQRKYTFKCDWHMKHYRSIMGLRSWPCCAMRNHAGNAFNVTRAAESGCLELAATEHNRCSPDTAPGKRSDRCQIIFQWKCLTIDSNDHQSEQSGHLIKVEAHISTPGEIKPKLAASLDTTSGTLHGQMYVDNCFFMDLALCTGQCHVETGSRKEQT